MNLLFGIAALILAIVGRGTGKPFSILLCAVAGLIIGQIAWKADKYDKSR
jgi:outer membrane lipoprotein SlyB